ncbi:MAG: fimbria/pilus outer membrane usher protein [Pseudomonadota bacterium]
MRKCLWLTCIVLLTAFQAFPTSYANEPGTSEVPLDVPLQPTELRGPLTEEEAASRDGLSLFLDVVINGHRKQLIAEFRGDPGGRLSAEAGELREIGVDPGDGRQPKDRVYLDELTGIAYKYEATEQAIYIDLDPTKSTLAKYSARGTVHDVPVLTPGYGAALNYSISGQISSGTKTIDPSFNGGSALLDGWLFSPYGSIYQSGIVDFASNSKSRLRRLDTYWSHTIVEKQLTLRAGDLISGGLAWTRPIRMGGVQARHNFRTRPDLIIQPLPQFEGTAAVPSTVDVYLGNLRLSSTEVDTGRFLISDLPTPTGSGELRVVVQDATGKRTEQTLPFGTSERLLRKGLYDYSASVGVTRTGYASINDNYGDTAIFSGSLRYGLTDEHTLELHSEGGAGLVNGGAGILVGLGPRGTLNFAGAASTLNGRRGGLVSAGYSYGNRHYSFKAETRRLVGDYVDLADTNGIASIDFSRLDRVIAYDRLFAGIRLPNTDASLGLGYSHTESTTEGHRHFVTATLGKRMSDNAHFSLSAQSEVSRERNIGIYAGMTFTLDDNKSASVGVSSTEDGLASEATYSKSRGQKPGSYGYSASIRKSKKITRGALRASYVGDVNDFRVSLDASKDSVTAYGTVEGGVAIMGGNVHLSRRIDDSFAVVDAGAPNVVVYHENQPVGKTGRSGQFLVPGIRSFESNKVSIEPNDLPVNSAVSETQRRIALPERSGTLVKFDGVGKASSSALVILVDAAGAHIPVGSVVAVQGSDEEHIVGYDGQAFLSGLSSNNQITVNTSDVECRASFEFAARIEAQTQIGPVVCQ